jgi:hypothetical protein
MMLGVRPTAAPASASGREVESEAGARLRRGVSARRPTELPVQSVAAPDLNPQPIVQSAESCSEVSDQRYS